MVLSKLSAELLCCCLSVNLLHSRRAVFWPCSVFSKLFAVDTLMIFMWWWWWISEDVLIRSCYVLAYAVTVCVCCAVQNANPNQFSLVEVMLDKGVSERELNDDEKPWIIMQKNRRVRICLPASWPSSIPNLFREIVFICWGSVALNVTWIFVEA